MSARLGPLRSSARLPSLVGALLLVGCSPSSSRDPRPPGDGSSTPPPRSVVPKLVAEIPLPTATEDQLPLRYALGADESLAVQLPATQPPRIARTTSDGQTSERAGLLLANAPLAFVAASGEVTVESLDGKVSYSVAERVTGPGPWAPTAAGTGCCGFAESTMWRADPGRLEGGLLRVVSPPTGAWSVLDFHTPGSPEPRWRVSLTEGKRSTLAAAVVPGAEQVVVVIADAQGAAQVQARSSSDGEVRWATALDSAVADWRSGGRIALSRDGARMVLLVESRQRCATCTALQVLDLRTGALGRRIEIEPIVAPRFCELGIDDHGGPWLFEYVPRKASDMATREKRCRYLAYDATTGALAAAPDSGWQLASCAVWGMSAHPSRSGVAALTWADAKVRWLASPSRP